MEYDVSQEKLVIKMAEYLPPLLLRAVCVYTANHINDERETALSQEYYYLRFSNISRKINVLHWAKNLKC